MVDLPKLDLIGFTSILAGLIFLASGILIFLNATNTTAGSVNLSVVKFFGLLLVLVGLLLFVSRDE